MPIQPFEAKKSLFGRHFCQFATQKVAKTEEKAAIAGKNRDSLCETFAALRLPIDEIGIDGVVVRFLDRMVHLTAVGFQIVRSQDVVDAEEHLVAVVAEAKAVSAERVGVFQQTGYAVM